ncbi:MAG: hypothetical protein U5K56_21115 [Halioglobus sp.]|nr:hypothetical protein [Halioglobus sp.]
MTYRIVTWGTGNVGRRAVMAVLNHPALELPRITGAGVHRPAE